VNLAPGLPFKYVFVPLQATIDRRLHNIFGKKQVVHCAVCNVELGRHKYRPAKEWNMDGQLCADCHIEKTKEFMLAQQRAVEAPDTCANCGKEILSAEDRNKPKWQWDMASGLFLCHPCYLKKDAEHGKKMNSCAACGGKLALIFYHPKPSWKIQGNLCRKCWDAHNSRGM